MKIVKIRRFFLLLIVISILFLFPAFANSAEPPNFTVIVMNPPADLSLSLQFPDDTTTDPVVLSSEKKGWETYYRFFRHSFPRGKSSLKGAALVVNDQNETFHCDLPWDSLSQYNKIATLDVENRTLISGQPVWRVPVLVALRVILTLLIEGLIFFAFGYRNKKSWAAFFMINLITQGALNALITGPLIGTYWLFGFIAIEVLVLVSEMILFALMLREYRKRRAVFYAFTANIASLLLGGAIISYLPI